MRFVALALTAVLSTTFPAAHAAEDAASNEIVLDVCDDALTGPPLTPEVKARVENILRWVLGSHPVILGALVRLPSLEDIARFLPIGTAWTWWPENLWGLARTVLWIRYLNLDDLMLSGVSFQYHEREEVGPAGWNAMRYMSYPEVARGPKFFGRKAARDIFAQRIVADATRVLRALVDRGECESWWVQLFLPHEPVHGLAKRIDYRAPISATAADVATFRSLLEDLEDDYVRRVVTDVLSQNASHVGQTLKLALNALPEFKPRKFRSVLNDLIAQKKWPGQLAEAGVLGSIDAWRPTTEVVESEPLVTDAGEESARSPDGQLPLRPLRLTSPAAITFDALPIVKRDLYAAVHAASTAHLRFTDRDALVDLDPWVQGRPFEADALGDFGAALERARGRVAAQRRAADLTRRQIEAVLAWIEPTVVALARLDDPGNATLHEALMFGERGQASLAQARAALHARERLNDEIDAALAHVALATVNAWARTMVGRREALDELRRTFAALVVLAKGLDPSRG